MKNLFCATLFLCVARVEAIPNQITYQGTLKEQGVPVSGTRNMQFQLTSPDGAAVYWSSGLIPVTVNRGLFSVPLAPSGVDWQGVTPSMEVTVDGQLLLPREPLTASAYSLMSGSVVDGAVTTPKLADGAVTFVKLDPAAQGVTVPSGLIALFASACPPGWSRFSALDNQFPMGGLTYGATGGAATHTHAISTDGVHNHGGLTGFETIDGDPRGSDGSWVARFHHQHTINSDGAHNHGGSTGQASNLPPYLTVVFCQKQ